jgi:hypothetical protein
MGSATVTATVEAEANDANLELVNIDTPNAFIKI